jgi:predicted transcriptional regulator
MSERLVPSWFSAVGFAAQSDRLYDMFIDVLHNLPMSSSELARRLGVSQPAVSRWASGAAHPSLEQMEATLDIVEGCVAGMAERATRAREVFDLVDRAILVSECQCVPSMPFCDTCSLRSNAVRDELQEVQVRLATLLRETGGPGGPDTSES